MPQFRPASFRPLLAAPLALALVLLSGAGRAATPRVDFPDLSLTPDATAAEALGLAPGAPSSLSRIPAQGLVLVLVNYFCPPCHQEMPRIKELARRIRERGLSGRIRMLGLAAGDDQALVDRFLKLHGPLGFPLLPDPALAAHKRLNSPPVPTLYVVSVQGGRLTRVAVRQGEFAEAADPFLDAMLKELPKTEAKARRATGTK